LVFLSESFFAGAGFSGIIKIVFGGFQVSGGTLPNPPAHGKKSFYHMSNKSAESNLKRDLRRFLKKFPVMLQFDKYRRFTGLMIFKPPTEPGHGHWRTARSAVRKPAQQE
jgi:hypothetical protein